MSRYVRFLVLGRLGRDRRGLAVNPGLVVPVQAAVFGGSKKAFSRPALAGGSRGGLSLSEALRFGPCPPALTADVDFLTLATCCRCCQKFALWRLDESRASLAKCTA